MDWPQIVFVALIGYLLGAFPSAYLMARVLKGVDIRAVGSRNVGAGNTFRSVGFLPGATVMVLDVGKGMLAVQAPVWLGEPGLMYLSGAFAVVGHNWSVFLRWNGGKGAATALGTFIVVAPVLTAIIAIPSAIVMLLARHSNGASVTGFVLMNALAVTTGQPLARIAFFLSVTAIVIAAQITREGLPWTAKALDPGAPLLPASPSKEVVDAAVAGTDETERPA